MGFAEDISAGLTAKKKYIPSRYFYDAEGDALFRAIMKLPEYYLTRCEYEIIERCGGELVRELGPDPGLIELAELGAGDGTKTKVLLSHFAKAGIPLRYVPVDISANALQLLADDMKVSFPEMETAPIRAEYFEALQQLKLNTSRPAVVLFLGSSIGNMDQTRTEAFMQGLHGVLTPGDRIAIGFDLQKNPHTILAAYNDSQGVTAAFNKNVLKRANRELGANFNLDFFLHYPMYEPLSGEARSYLVSTQKQAVQIEALGISVQLEEGECIHTEMSRKYTLESIHDIFAKAGFGKVTCYYDSRHYYTLALSTRI